MYRSVVLLIPLRPHRSSVQINYGTFGKGTERVEVEVFGAECYEVVILSMILSKWGCNT